MSRLDVYNTTKINLVVLYKVTTFVAQPHMELGVWYVFDDVCCTTLPHTSLNVLLENTI